MSRRNRIIVLIDFSAYSQNLTDFAFSMADIVNAKVIFVHQTSGFAPAMADYESRSAIVRAEEEEAHSRLRSLVKGRVYGDDSYHVSSAPILSTLKKLSNDQYHDWVFAGLKGAGVLKRLFIGSTTLAIIDESDLLTVAVPARKPLDVPTKLMVGLSPKYALNRQQFKNLLSSLSDHIKEVEFFTVLGEDEDEAKATEQLSSLQAEYETYDSSFRIYKGNDAFSLLKTQVEMTENSFLVVQQGSRSLSDKIFRKFMINELVYNGETPLIVLSS